MKNIHILATDKPSCKLQKTKHGNFFLSNEIKLYSDCINQNIYITSDEEIKIGDWCIDEDGLKKCTAHAGAMNHYFQKIILTTDQDLIKDGVQAIPDEFLEWFVKNPSCEWVLVGTEIWNDGTWNYFLPKEEPKKSCEHSWIRSADSFDLTVHCGKCGIDNQIVHLMELLSASK